MAMEDKNRKNPWLGLESYQEGEVLYGRDDDIRDLTQCVLNDTETLLYGKSGIGKSSILNAGIIPAARRYGYIPVLIRLSHKEEHSYLHQIKVAISNVITVNQVVECKEIGKESIYEYFHRHTFHDDSGGRVKLLIVFDQFEEIFTLQDDESKKKQFFAGLADFLNDIMPSELQMDTILQMNSQEEIKDLDEGSFDDLFKDLGLTSKDSSPEYVTDNDIHFVFTIREDFLSEFEYYSASIPSLKQNRYGLRPINEEQAAQIVLRPIPGLIDKSVAKLIIEKVTGRTDFELNNIPEIEVDSAVLSLYLNRLFDARNGEKITAELVEQKGGEIIADFYNDAISNISESTIVYLEDMLLNGQGRRDNISVFDVIHDGGVTEEELNILCNKKKILRQFNYAGDLRIEYVHDILCPIVKAHKNERLLLKQQEEERLRQEKEKQELVRRQNEELKRIETENERQRKKNRLRLAFALSLLLIGGISWIAWYLLYRYPFKANYASFTIKNGWPEGIGQELDNKDIIEMPVFYQLVRYGYRSKNTRVNVLNSHKELVSNIFMSSPLVDIFETEGTDEKAKTFACMQRNTAYWIYSPDNEGNILRETAYDIGGNQLYSVQFFYSSSSVEETEKQLWANYVDKDGKSMRVRDNGADRIRLVVNDDGYYVGQQFFSEMGTPQSNRAGIYGYRYLLGEDGRITKSVPLDAFGDSVNGQTEIYTSFDKYGRWIKALKGCAEYKKDIVIMTRSNRIDSLIFNDVGMLTRYATEILDSSYSSYMFSNNVAVNISLFRNTGEELLLNYQKKILSQTDHDVITQEFLCGNEKPYRLTCEERKDRKGVESYYCGKTPSTINEPCMKTILEGSYHYYYHKIVTDTILKDDWQIVTIDYLDTLGNPSASCDVNRDVAYYNAKHEKIKHFGYHNGVVCFAYQNDYSNGQIVAQSVIDDDGTIVRYPQRDIYKLCYYKMKLVYDFSNMLIAIKGVNEFGEESLITSDNQEYRCEPLPSIKMISGENNAQITGLQVYKEILRPINKDCMVEYIRITDKAGTWYKAGLRSGDLLVDNNKKIKIARPNEAKKSYDVYVFSPAMGERGAETYPVYFTQKEMNRYNNAIKK